MFNFQSSRTVSYSDESYNLPHSLVSLRFSPRVRSPPAIFFSRFTGADAGAMGGGAGGASGAGVALVHDFATDTQFVINKR